VEKAAGTHWIGGWVDARAGLEEEAKKKRTYPAPSPFWDSKAGRPVIILTEQLWLTVAQMKR
jgi:hypothetical protein